MTLSGGARLCIVAVLLAALVGLLALGESDGPDWLAAGGLVVACLLAMAAVYGVIRWLIPVSDSETRAEATRRAKLPKNLKPPVR